MEKIDIKVRKGKNGSFIDGPFFVKTLDFDECIALHEKRDKDENNNWRLIQMCLVFSDGSPVFKPQQMNVIKDRLSGVDIMAVLMEANGQNDFSKIGTIAEKYQKNSEGDQDSE